MHRSRNCIGVTMALAVLLCTATTTNSSPYSDAIEALNPDAYYRFDGSGGAGSDETGNHDFSSVEGGINFNVAGPRPANGFQGMDVANDAWDFSSGLRAQVMDYVPAAGQEPRTVIGWFNTDVTRAQHGGAIDLFGWSSNLRPANTFKGWSLKVQAGFDSNPDTFGALGYDVVTLNITGREVQGKNTPIEPGDWHMVGVVYDGGPLGSAEIYVDGVLQELLNDTGVTPADPDFNLDDPDAEPSPYGFFIGRDAGGFAMDGQIDHVAIFTADEGGSGAGDYDNNGVVGAGDYVLFRNNLGEDSNLLANNEIPGPITSDHYDQWRDNFGSTSGDPISPVRGQDIIDLWNLAKDGLQGAGSTTSIPEPSGILLALLVSIAWLGSLRPPRHDAG